MEFLDDLVLPQSAEHIELLHYMLSLVLILFIPFISIVFGGLILSLYHKRKGLKNSDSYALKYAKDVIQFVTVNNGVGVILGIVPLLTAILIFAQLLHTAQVSTVSYLALSFLFVTVGLIMTYVYRHSFVISQIFSSVDKNNISDQNAITEVEKLKFSTQTLAVQNGKWAVLFLFIGIWLFIGAITTAANFSIFDVSGVLQLLFSYKVIINLLIFISFAFVLTGSAVLFGYLYWKENLQITEEYRNFLRTASAKTALYFAVPLPFLIALNLFSIPESFLSGTVFFYGITALLLIFLGWHFIYMILQYKKYNYSALLFFTIIFAVMALIIKDQVAITNATATHSIVLSTQFDEMLSELRGAGGIAEISGKELYEVRCASCHQFEQKLVGPPHKDVLPKYIGKESQLVAFIRNPVKIDPAYPPMPNPGLKPQEAEAVAKYLMETYKDRLN
ncbi:MAG TPA: c-type cytochrome [Ignavibacteriaceae bacterium]|nr:c-type cytochrome [Ignavibacteriaceae bacterium]